MADLPVPVPTIEFNLASTGMSKGIAQTHGPQMLVRGELAFGRLYVGGYAKNVTSPTSKAEAAAVIGVRTSAAGLDLAVSAAWKRAIRPSRGSDANALEVSGSVARRIGRMTPRISVVWSPDDLGATGRTIFAEASASYIVGKTLVASAALGRRQRTGGLNYTAWNAGMSWNPYKPVTLDLRYYDTDANAGQPFRPRLVASGRVRF